VPTFWVRVWQSHPQNCKAKQHLLVQKRLIFECKRALTSEFEMKDLGMMHYFLGLEVWQRTNEIFLSQGKYTLEILKKLCMTDCKYMPTPMVMD
jgi:hypothetical protein